MARTTCALDAMLPACRGLVGGGMAAHALWECAQRSELLAVPAPGCRLTGALTCALRLRHIV